MKLKTVTIRGYKSIANLEEFELRSLNVLIGANGAGKSNFISTFRFLAALANGNLQTFVQQQGGPDALLFGGRKQTRQLDIEVYFDAFHGFTNGYRIGLTPTADNRLIFGREEVWVQRDFGPKPIPLGAAHDEAKLRDDRQPVSSYVRTAMRSWRQYHFHDTGDSAAVKRPHHSNDNLRLKPAADNLAAYLAMLQSRFPEVYRRIVDTIKLAAPFFGDFNIRDPLPDPIELEWFEQTDPDTPYKAHMLSDGTLRFICLATLLLQPETLLPDTVLIDEPELGLHPYAINLLADMLRQVAETKQVIVSTQSVELLNCFTPADVVVAERQDGATTLKRLDADGLGEWLEEYSLGELWKRNILGGRPAR
ncbi:AAA family ATPase [Mycobacterium sp. KBS0706]|uniref:AAA family ATPase n=1 Tax=Mycobacterium sp. KBS0706 TaxID=2578109 RepID=UPI00110FB7C7|nr:AAA family ATPase [Mycobacterium sp. KBS0706]TSD88432.1 AAA family ATPase [Mycobacterium sp. KBS0706]